MGEPAAQGHSCVVWWGGHLCEGLCRCAPCSAANVAAKESSTSFPACHSPVSPCPALPYCPPPPAGEALDGQNKYKCPKQQKAVRAIKRMTVDRAPNVLMIQLKRFEFSLSGHKISKKVGRRAAGWVGGWLAGWLGGWVDGFSWVGGWVWLPCLFALAHCPPLSPVFPLLHCPMLRLLSPPPLPNIIRRRLTLTWSLTSPPT